MDGITVRIAYEQAREIEKYYDCCAEEGSTIEQINASKIAMSKMTAILSHPDRIKKLAADIVEHYERLCAEKPKIVQKAMIFCADRKIALKVLRAICSIRPAWCDAKKSDDESNLSKDRLEKLVPLPKINLVATQGQDDPPELFNLCGTKDYRKKLDKQFKNDDSNFKFAVVVDYIGFKNAMLAAVKQYGSPQENPVDELKISLNLLREYLSLLNELTTKFDTTKFFSGSPSEGLNCLNAAAEFVQTKKDTETRFMSVSKKLKASSATKSPLICSAKIFCASLTLSKCPSQGLMLSSSRRKKISSLTGEQIRLSRLGS